VLSAVELMRWDIPLFLLTCANRENRLISFSFVSLPAPPPSQPPMSSILAAAAAKTHENSSSLDPPAAAAAGSDATSASSDAFVCDQAQHPSSACAVDPAGPGGAEGTAVVSSCHCGLVHVQVSTAPTEVTNCNCSICGRLGTLWAYYPRASVSVRGHTAAYAWRDEDIAFHRCPRCGCTTHWAPFRDAQRDRMGVNARLMPLDVQQRARVRKLDGAHTEKYVDEEQ